MHITAPVERGVDDLSKTEKTLVRALDGFEVFFISIGFITPSCSINKSISLLSLSLLSSISFTLKPMTSA